MRIRKKIHGTAERPRLSVYRSLKNMYAQLIDDENGVTIVSASSLKDASYGGNVDAAKRGVGKKGSRRLRLQRALSPLYSTEAATSTTEELRRSLKAQEKAD